MALNATKFCGHTFEFSPAERSYLEKLAPLIGGVCYELPEPKECLDCLNQRRMTFRNDRNFYRNNCFLCQKSVISIYSPDKPWRVLCADCFWSDNFDPLAYGADFDFNRPFFEQFAQMRFKVPRLAIYNTQSENSDFIVHSSKNRNCYMASSLVGSEDVYYADFVHDSRDSMDCLMCYQMELCYECVDCKQCFNSDYLQLCENVSDSYLAFDCKGGRNLVGCVGLRNRNDLILNRPADLKEIELLKRRLKTEPKFREEFVQEFESLKLSVPRKENWSLNVENCSGNYITDSKNAQNCFHVWDVEDCRNVYESLHLKDALNCNRVTGETIYECTGAVDLKNSAFCNLVYQSDNLFYSDNCMNSKNSFGCVSLKKHEFCILNKQYAPPEYYELAGRIIEHMQARGEFGEFFPVFLSPFGYNESKAYEWFPLKREQVLERGFKWHEEELGGQRPEISLRDDIAEVGDDILEQSLICEVSGKPYRIIKQELLFYRRKGLPIPRKCFKQRNIERLAKQEQRALFERKCDKCAQVIQSSYPAGCPDKVYCEKCYLAAIF